MSKEQQSKPSRWTRLSNRKKMIGGLGAATVVGVGSVVTSALYYNRYYWHLHYYQFTSYERVFNVCIVRNKSQEQAKVIDIRSIATFNWDTIKEDFNKRYKEKRGITTIDASTFTEGSQKKHTKLLKLLREKNNLKDPEIKALVLENQKKNNRVLGGARIAPGTRRRSTVSAPTVEQTYNQESFDFDDHRRLFSK